MAILKPIFEGKTEGDQLISILKVLGSFNNQEITYFKSKVPFETTMIDELGKFRKVNLKPQIKISSSLKEI